MLSTLGEKIHDNRFLRLVEGMLKAGYLEDWRWHDTLSGCPQGGVASPVMSNIYLDRFDQYVEQRLLPEYNLGRRRRPNRAYQVLETNFVPNVHTIQLHDLESARRGWHERDDRASPEQHGRARLPVQTGNVQEGASPWPWGARDHPGRRRVLAPVA